MAAETCARHRIRSRYFVIGIIAVVFLATPFIGLTGDFGGDLAKKAVGRAAREGIEDALKDEALDTTLDAAARGVVEVAGPDVRDRYDSAEIGEAVGDGVEVAMRAADVADTLDDVADVTKTLNKVNKIREGIR